MAGEYLQGRIAELENELAQARAREKELGDLLEKKLNEIYIHYHVSRTVGSLLSLQDMLLQVITTIGKTLPCERVSVYLLDEKQERLNLVFYNGIDLVRGVSLLPGEGTPGRIVENGEHVHIHDLAVFYQTFNDFIHHPGEAKRDGSFIGIALKVHQTTIGVIGMDNPQKYGLTVDDMDFMAILSHQLAAGIEMSLLFDRINLLSQRDGLTGLYNHRIFKEKLHQEMTRRRRNGRPLALLMIDIDHFKQLNDTYGHQAGDTVLRDLAAVITKQTRGNDIDICCRYGGEEFMVIMPELDLSQALIVAERLRKAVEAAPFRIRTVGSEIQLTVSLGVACIKSGVETTIDQFIKEADDALYVSKRNGRNRSSALPR
ncbi:MAG TPA: sensor domain-containing diguanylate cyclase [Nitrospirota bacterium]|nr:sensor domain-containing diguanylate cyclase [Nitrospirota bacterium]